MLYEVYRGMQEEKRQDVFLSGMVDLQADQYESVPYRGIGISV